jgi:hypothetical protein
MHIRTKQTITMLGVFAAAVAPMGLLCGFHLYAQTQPATCEDHRDLILGGERGAGFGTVTTCYAWGWWQVSKTLRRDDD